MTDRVEGEKLWGGPEDRVGYMVCYLVVAAIGLLVRTKKRRRRSSNRGPRRRQITLAIDSIEKRGNPYVAEEKK